MHCYHCGHELIWGGDHDIDDVEEYDMVSNLSCPRCNAYVEVYRHSGKEESSNVIDTHTEFFTYPEEPSPTPDASWLDKKEDDE